MLRVVLVKIVGSNSVMIEVLQRDDLNKAAKC